MKTLKISLLLLLATTLYNCSKDDPVPVNIPTVNYQETTIDPIYFVQGESTPSINWNGSVGNFTIQDGYSAGISGLSIDADTGKLSWTRNLGEGIWNFDVLATNSAGTTTIPMTIDNTLDVEFVGTYNTTFYYRITFNKDHTAELSTDVNNAPGFVTTGTWSINNANEITINYLHASTGLPSSVKGILNQNVFEGQYYSGYNAVLGNEIGIFYLVYLT